MLTFSTTCLAIALAISPHSTSAFTGASRSYALPLKLGTLSSLRTPTLLNADLEAEYDYIVVGLGYAGAILTARLAERDSEAKILAIEYGGPVQAKTGGSSADDVNMDMTASMFQNEGAKDPSPSTYDPKSPLCMADVPGNYNNVAFRPLSDGYHLEEFPACFQGTGLGGNGVYNGALYQEPADWWWNDDVFTDIFVSPEDQEKGVKPSEVMKRYFYRVKDELSHAITSFPSMDSVHYNHGLYDLVKPWLIKAGFDEAPFNVPELNRTSKRFYTIPTVNSFKGFRTGASAWLEKFLDPDGNVRDEFENLEVMTYTEVLNVTLAEDNSVTGVFLVENVEGARRGGLKKFPQSNPVHVKVKEGGKVILGCGALPTNRILYRSGVGPELLRKNVMPSRDTAFQVNNDAVGTTINEHVTTSLGFKYTGEEKEQPNSVHFDPADFNGNSKHLADYARERKGPYCQFGPVVASHFVADLSLLDSLPEDQRNGLDDGEVTTELFYNPFGAGPYPPVNNRALNPYNGPGTYTVYVMLLRPEMRALFRLDTDEKESGQYVQCYMNDGPADFDPTPEQREILGLPDYRELAKKDVATMTASVAEVLKITNEANDIEINLGPGDPHSSYLYVNVNGKSVPISELDPANVADVRGYVTFYDGASIVNGEYLAMTRLEENHYHSSVPLARNLDVFGKDLGNRKDTYGVNPDTMEVKGTKGLCVVDSSIFPKVVYCHPIGSVMAMAEYAADKICPLTTEEIIKELLPPGWFP